MHFKKAQPILFLKGFLMGSADIIPGVSGGTVALLVGVYERLIIGLSNFGLATLIDVFKTLRGRGRGRGRGIGMRGCIDKYDLRFFALLGAGILSAVLIASRFIPQLLEKYPGHMNALFFGLIAVSAYVPYMRLGTKRPVYIIYAIIAAVVAFILVGLPVTSVKGSYGMLFTSGAIAICAMILPGVSGSYLLKTMGQYTRVLDAVHTRDLLSLFVFVLGMVVGILSFVRVLKYLLNRHHDSVMAVLTGLMVGSLRSVWPWRSEFIPDAQLLSPSFTGDGLAYAALMLAGALIVLLLIAVERKNTEPQVTAG